MFFARLMALQIALLVLTPATPSPATGTPQKERKVSTLRGVVFRGEKSQTVANAQIFLLTFQGRDQEEEKYDTKTDAAGAYRFENLPGGKYRITIRVAHATREQVPCKLRAAKTSDQNSVVSVIPENEQYIEQIFIDGYSIKSGREIEKDFDLQCRPMFSTAASEKN